MSIVYNCNIPNERDEGFIAANAVLKQGQCVVIPTDTVYGVAADAFSATGVSVLLAAKGRGRQMPPPVLMSDPALLDVLACEVSDEARRLAETFWPGALTLIVRARPSLQWDLGETAGTVALRVPDDECARQLLELTGPLAVSSANRTGNQASNTVVSAQEQLREAVSIYLDAGPRPIKKPANVESQASTIVDMTDHPSKVVRRGLIGVDRLERAVPSLVCSQDGGTT